EIPRLLPQPRSPARGAPVDRRQGGGPQLSPRRSRRRRLLLAAVMALPACGGSPTSPTPVPTASSGSCAAGTPVPGPPALTTVLVARGLSSPLDLKAAPGDRSRLFVVEQAGRIRVIRDGNLLSGAFLDVSGRISSGGERGLLGLAFHPGYAQNG